MLVLLFINILGIAILMINLVTSARMGHYQENLFARYGKHPRQALFFYGKIYKKTFEYK